MAQTKAETLQSEKVISLKKVCINYQ